MTTDADVHDRLAGATTMRSVSDAGAGHVLSVGGNGANLAAAEQRILLEAAQDRHT